LAISSFTLAVSAPGAAPTTFDWLSGIILPAVFGFLSLLLAAVSLWIAIHAQKTSNAALEIAT
jgi:hypothetical protein